MNNTKILIYMLDHKEEKFTINQLSKKLNLNYRIAHQTIKSLEKEQLIKTEKAGRSLLCSLTYKFNEKLFSAEYQRTQKLLKNKTFKVIHKRFSEIQQNFILLLFGSQAKKQADKHSDIDLLAITENEKEIKETAELMPLNIHLTTTTYNSFIQMIKSNELTVGSEVLKNNIILIGIEDYYRLLKNAQ
jgi:predicted nucleotidyltransferase